MRIIEINPHVNEPDLTGCNVSRLFLAGTIDAGNSNNWQKDYIQQMTQLAFDVSCCRSDEKGYDADKDVILIYNPRREKYPEDNSYELEYQIQWELDSLELCDSIYMNILPDSKSPITLMELGLYARSGKLKVVCPKEFYRYENVKQVCKKYHIPFKNSHDDLRWITK